MRAGRRSPLLGYVAALFAVIAGAAARVVTDPFFEDRVPFAFLFGAVSTIAFFGRLGPAIFAAVLSAIVGQYLFLPPRYEFAVSLSELAVIGFFLLGCGLVIGLATRVNQARERMESAAESAEAQVTAVQYERMRLGQMISSIPGVVWEAWGEPDSSRQRIDYVSDYVTPLLGYTPEEWTTTPNFWLQLVVPEDREAAARVAA